MRRRRKKKKQGDREPDRVRGNNKVLGIKLKGTVKRGVEAQRQKHSHHIPHYRNKKGVCSFNLSDAARLNGIFLFQLLGLINYLLTMQWNMAALLFFSSKPNLPSFKVFCELLFISSYQLSDLSSLNVIFISSSIAQLRFYFDTLLTR